MVGIDSLKVPKVRAILEYTNFIILFILYVQALEGLNKKKVNARESLFIVYALGTILARDLRCSWLRC